MDHIVKHHPDLRGQERLILDVLKQPELIVQRLDGELIACRQTSSGRRLAVVYSELESDGFVITAFLFKGSRYYLDKTSMAIDVTNYLKLIPDLLESHSHRAMLDYDAEADVLYINLEPGAQSDDAYDLAPGVIAHEKDNRIVLYTVLNARKRGLAT